MYDFVNVISLFQTNIIDVPYILVEYRRWILQRMLYTQLRFWINNVDVYTSWFRILEGFMPDWYLTLVFPLNLSLYDSVESHIASASLGKNFIMVYQYHALASTV